MLSEASYDTCWRTNTVHGDADVENCTLPICAKSASEDITISPRLDRRRCRRAWYPFGSGQRARPNRVEDLLRLIQRELERVDRRKRRRLVSALDSVALGPAGIGGAVVP